MVSKLHQVKLRFRSFRVSLRFATLRFFARSEFLARVYYCFFSKSLGREARAVLNGRLQFRDQSLESTGSEFSFRRGVHRLEKGLSMNPRRPVFAKLYIMDVVQAFAGRYDSRLREEKREQMEWAESVLGEYFRVVQAGQHAKVDMARELFEATIKAGADEPISSKKPYRELERRGRRIEYDALRDLVKWRRSVRWFTEKPVPRDVFEQAVAIATEAPSACNRQPFQYRFFDDPALVKKAASLPPGVREIADNFASFVVIVGRLEAYSEEKDRHAIYIDASLATMLLLLALETLGVSSCCINWPDSEPEETKMREFLKLKPHERAVMCLAIGYAAEDGMIPYSGKKPPSDLVVYN